MYCTVNLVIAYVQYFPFPIYEGFTIMPCVAMSVIRGFALFQVNFTWTLDNLLPLYD